MDIVGPDILPEPRCYNVPEWITLVMKHHFWFPGCSGREENHHWIGTPCLFHAGKIDKLCRNRGRIIQFDLVTDPPCPFTVNHHSAAKCRTVLGDFIDFIRMLFACYDHLDISNIDAVFQILWSEHGRSGAIHCTPFDQRKGERPPFRHSW